MAKVLIIEPHKLLQQAIALALFPEHETRVAGTASAAAIGDLPGIDLIIIDAGALRDRDQLSPDVLRAVEQAPVPVLWLDDDGEARPPKRDKLELVPKPIERDALQGALAALLSGAAAPPPRRKARAASAPKGAEGKASRKKPAGEPAPSEIPMIDLVEIVEGEPAALETGESPGKSK